MVWEARVRDIGEALDYEDGEWDMFERISTAYHGKQYYFLQENGKVYSRASGFYLDFEEAVAEFIKEVSGDDEA